MTTDTDKRLFEIRRNHELCLNQTMAHDDRGFLLAEIDRMKGERVELIKAGFISCVDMGPPDEVESDGGTHTTTYTWEEPDYDAVLSAYLQSKQGKTG